MENSAGLLCFNDVFGGLGTVAGRPVDPYREIWALKNIGKLWCCPFFTVTGRTVCLGLNISDSSGVLTFFSAGQDRSVTVVREIRALKIVGNLWYFILL